MSNVPKAMVAVLLVAAGMAGLHLKVEYSGWVLFAGLAVAWSVA